jgi:ribosomal protein S12 methylthiotransferase accessory factor
MATIRVRFPGGKRVDAECGAHLIRTDQPAESGGEATAPDPFTLFLASLATCAGYYVLAFCDARKIPVDGVRVELDHEKDAAGALATARVRVELPDGFPEKYVDGVRRAAEGCKVHKTLKHPPAVAVDVIAR